MQKINRNVLIVGASQGLGEAIALDYGLTHKKIWLVGRNKPNLVVVRSRIKELGASCFFSNLNMMEAGASNLLAQEMSTMGFSPDIVIYNIGGALSQKDVFASVDSYFKVWLCNVGVQIELNSLLIPPMIKRNWGRVISLSSTQVKNSPMLLEPFGGSIQYNSAKAYLNAYNKSLAREVAPYGVVVSTVMPGPFVSPGKYWDRQSISNPELVAKFLERHVSIGRFARFNEIVPIIKFLGGDLASYCNGLEVNVDGGWN
jgi:3-oxoacyl-[acyl-carrier protein] reductase